MRRTLILKISWFLGMVMFLPDLKKLFWKKYMRFNRQFFIRS